MAGLVPAIPIRERNERAYLSEVAGTRPATTGKRNGGNNGPLYYSVPVEVRPLGWPATVTNIPPP